LPIFSVRWVIHKIVSARNIFSSPAAAVDQRRSSRKKKYWTGADKERPLDGLHAVVSKKSCVRAATAPDGARRCDDPGLARKAPKGGNREKGGACGFLSRIAFAGGK
jgi:hypothetical protein